jgi:hypothetical protein
MFLRSTQRKKNGKTHVYWNIVENKRLADGRTVQRQALYLGEITTGASFSSPATPSQSPICSS